MLVLRSGFGHAKKSLFVRRAIDSRPARQRQMDTDRSLGNTAQHVIVEVDLVEQVSVPEEEVAVVSVVADAANDAGQVAGRLDPIQVLDVRLLLTDPYNPNDPEIRKVRLPNAALCISLHFWPSTKIRIFGPVWTLDRFSAFGLAQCGVLGPRWQRWFLQSFSKKLSSGELVWLTAFSPTIHFPIWGSSWPLDHIAWNQNRGSIQQTARLSSRIWQHSAIFWKKAAHGFQKECTHVSSTVAFSVEGLQANTVVAFSQKSTSQLLPHLPPRQRRS